MIDVCLVKPKYLDNLAGAVRAAACLGADRVFYTGDRIPESSTKQLRLPRALRMKDYADVELIHTERPFEASSGIPVAVELLPGATVLPIFDHPDDVLYVFGAEDGDVPAWMRQHCHHFVSVPTVDGMCLNLAATVNVVLYDRLAKVLCCV